MDPIAQPNQAAAHPLAGQAMSGAQIIVQVLADEGVTAIFGYSGGAILPTYDAVFTFNEAQRGAGGREIPLIVPANEQGAGFMAAGYARASGRVGVCLVTSGPGRHQHRDAGARLHGRFGADRGHLRPGAGRGHRHRRLPGSAGGRTHGSGRQARVPGHRSRRDSKPRCAPPSRSRAPAGPVRWWSTFRRTCRTGPGPIEAAGTLADSGLPPPRRGAGREHGRPRTAGRLRRAAVRIAAPADLCRRRRDQRRGVRGADRVCRGPEHPGGHDADGHRQHRYRASAVPCACSACTGWPPPITRSRIATS